VEIVAAGPLAVASLVWQPRPSAFTLTVVAKATYSLQQGQSVVAEDPAPILDRDRYRDEKPGGSVLAPTDLVPVKPRAEVMIVGHAFAPGKQPARSVLVRVAVGELDKRLEVCCERAMGQDGSIQEGTGFLRMPLMYERAAGGPGTWNPVGVRTEARDTYGRRVLPNVQIAGTAVKALADVIEPAGLGPVAPTGSRGADRCPKASISLTSTRRPPTSSSPRCARTSESCSRTSTRSTPS
jgi:hypothetical protein